MDVLFYNTIIKITSAFGRAEDFLSVSKREHTYACNYP